MGLKRVKRELWKHCFRGHWSSENRQFHSLLQFKVALGHGGVRRIRPGFGWRFCDAIFRTRRSLRYEPKEEHWSGGIFFRQPRPWPVPLPQWHQRCRGIVACSRYRRLHYSLSWRAFLFLVQRGSRAWHPRPSSVQAPGHWQIQLLWPVPTASGVSSLQHQRKYFNVVMLMKLVRRPLRQTPHTSWTSDIILFSCRVLVRSILARTEGLAFLCTTGKTLSASVLKASKAKKVIKNSVQKLSYEPYFYRSLCRVCSKLWLENYLAKGRLTKTICQSGLLHWRSCLVWMFRVPSNWHGRRMEEWSGQTSDRSWSDPERDMDQRFD